MYDRPVKAGLFVCGNAKLTWKHANLTRLIILTALAAKMRGQYELGFWDRR